MPSASRASQLTVALALLLACRGDAPTVAVPLPDRPNFDVVSAPDYSMTLLTTPTGYVGAVATGINAGNDISGYGILSNGKRMPIRWQGVSPPLILGMPAGYTSVSTTGVSNLVSIAEEMVISGTGTDASGLSKAVSFRTYAGDGGTWTVLPNQPYGGQALGVNEAGAPFGFVNQKNGTPFPEIWQGGNSNLNYTFGSGYGKVVGMSDSFPHLAVGSFAKPLFPADQIKLSEGPLWSSSVLNLSLSSAVVHDINRVGDIVAAGSIQGGGRVAAFLSPPYRGYTVLWSGQIPSVISRWSRVAGTDGTTPFVRHAYVGKLPMNGATSPTVLQVNTCGSVVGSVVLAGVTRAVLWFHSVCDSNYNSP